MKKILFVGIAGNSHSFLLSSYVLSSYAKACHEVNELVEIEIKDLKIPKNNVQSDIEDVERFAETFAQEVILAEIEKSNPDILALPVYVWNTAIIIKVLEFLKKCRNIPKVILGGPEIEKDMILNVDSKLKCADYFVIGEGEETFLNIIKYETSLVSDINLIPKLYYKCNNEIIYTGEVEKLDSNNDISAYLTGEVPDELLDGSHVVGIETQRGCNFKCSYCMYHKNYSKINYRDIDKVISELIYVYQKGARIIRILDANFFSDNDFAIKIIRSLIENNLVFKISMEVIPIKITEEIGKVLKEYIASHELCEIQMGIGLQSINPMSLKSIHRSLPKEAFDKAYDILLDAGAIIKTDIILGLPYESIDTYLDCLDFIVSKTKKEAVNFFALALLRILPGSDLVEIAKNEQISVDNSDDEHYILKTQTMNESDILMALRYNATVSRIFHTASLRGENSNKINLVNSYFKMKEEKELSNRDMICLLDGIFFEKVGANTSTYSFKMDYPSATNPYNGLSDQQIYDIMTGQLTKTY